MFVLSGYEYLLGFLIVCSLVPVLALTASKVVRPSRRGPVRRTTYESGMEPVGGAWIQFNIRYYMFALVFVVFDVETVLLVPWASCGLASGCSAPRRARSSQWRAFQAWAHSPHLQPWSS